MKTLILKRKQIIIFILTLTLCAAIVINWYYTGRGNAPVSPDKKEETNNLGEAKQVSSESEAVEASSNVTYFTNAKLKRDAETDETKDMLKEILESKDSGEASLKEAKEKLNEIIDNSNLQVDLEVDLSIRLMGIALIL